MRLAAVLLALLPVTSSGTGSFACEDSRSPEPQSSAIAEPVRMGHLARRAAAQSVELQLDLNVPSFQLDVYEDGIRTRRYRVAVGMRGYRTPRGAFEITSVEWNPWWIPPNSEWARNEKTTPPGSTNPMGRVKLNFMPLYFIHGTPIVSSLGGAASHGCVRVANADAISLARLVHGAGTPSLPMALLDSLLADTSYTRFIVLDAPVPIVIRYDLAEVEADTLVLHRDVYSIEPRNEQQLARDALREHGIDPEIVDWKRLSSRLRSTTRRPLKIALDELLIGTVGYLRVHRRHRGHGRDSHDSTPILARMPDATKRRGSLAMALTLLRAHAPARGGHAAPLRRLPHAR